MFYINIPRVMTSETQLTDKKTNLPLHEQKVVIEHPEKLCGVEASVMLRNDPNGNPKPFEPGHYELSADCLTGGKFGRPEFRCVVGRKIETAKNKAAA